MDEKTTKFDRFVKKIIKKDEDKTQAQTIYLVTDKTNYKSPCVVNTSFYYKSILSRSASYFLFPSSSLGVSFLKKRSEVVTSVKIS